MNQEAWDSFCATVAQEMSSHVSNFVTPLSMSKELGAGVAWGSGTYISGLLDGSPTVFILTAKHVITDLPENSVLGHLPDSNENYKALLSTPLYKGWPIDAGVLPVYSPALHKPENARTVPNHRIAPSFRAADDELFFWMGFPGHLTNRNGLVGDKTLRRTMFDILNTPWAPLLMRAVNPNEITHQAFDAQKHVGINYPLMGKQATDGKEVDLPNPKGMSGSALWDTKAVASKLAGKTWNPEMAEICGVIWGALEDPYAVIATKIEYVRNEIGVFAD